MSQDEFFVFQQDSAPAHREHNAVTFLRKRETRRHLSVCVRVRSAHFQYEF